ncbi:hypothetical protein F7725_004246 [Dissostichus mawsoni]|uniref:Focadhesin n=1 Tax=Dissostichus mawsoni TaxID=36200 RepID=A0A7J5XI49_DISMA|nr:hypothetical protein F7725_004246 [Dissostichus mawsoni]
MVRSSCCDAVVLLVEQQHAELQHVLHSVLNLLPSARNVQGLMKVIGRLLQMQADQRDAEKHFSCPYSISGLLARSAAEIDDFIQQAAERNEPAYVTMLAPFLRYLYCEPQRQPQHALLRHGLLRVLMPSHPAAGSLLQNKEQDPVDSVEAVLEFCGFVDALLQVLVPAPEQWRSERVGLTLQLLCACRRCLRLNADCRPLLNLLQQLLPACQQELPLDELLMGVALLLLEVPATQQTSLLNLALSLVPEHGELAPWLSPVLVLPSSPPLALPLSSWYNELSVALSVLRRVTEEPAAAADWLLSVSSALSSGQSQLCSLSLMVTHLLLTGGEDVCQLALKAIQALAAAEPCQVPSLLPVLLYKLGKEKNPVLAHAVLNCLPNLGTHKDRVYPDLQRLLGQQDGRTGVGRDVQWDQILSRAACLRDICRERPYQHGGDMLAAITLTLQQCTRPDMATPAALALQGLQELCRAEVVDIVSLWRTLGPQLSSDPRPQMVRVVSELLALKLKEEVVSFLWNNAVSKDPEVASCGYRALADFPEEAHTVNLLPEAIFLTSLVKQEMSQMPRGVYFSALRGGNLRSDQGKTMAGVPSFMLKTYEKNKQPGLKPGLAAGLLLSYELPVQTDREGRAMDRFLVSRSRSYQLTLAALIHEGRHADLGMQQKQGKEDPQEIQYKQHCAWLWARDQLTDVIKTATKDSPVVQGNAILALSGLASVLAKYESNLPADSGARVRAHCLLVGHGAEHSAQHQQLPALRTGVPMVPARDAPTRGRTRRAIARSCASLALSLLVPVWWWQREGLLQVLSALQAGLPGSSSAEDSQSLQFHSGLALGMKDTDVLRSALDALEGSAFNPDLEYNTGCVLGLGLVLASICSSGQTEQQVHVSQTLDRLLSTLQDSSGQGRMLQEVPPPLSECLLSFDKKSVLAYSVACVCVSAFSADIIDAAKAEEVMTSLRTLTEESQQGCPTMQRLAAVNGLVALVGSESYLFQQTGELELSSPQQSRLNQVIRAVTQIVTFSGAIGLQSNSACLLGHLQLAHMSTSHSHTAVPQDFSYLSEKSLLRSIIDFITEAGRKGGSDPVGLRWIQFPVPPINWSAVLSPLMRLSFREDVQHQCLCLASCQAQTSQSASLFLGSWLAPPLVHSLSLLTRAHLYEGLGLWMKHVAEDKLQVHTESLGLQQFQDDLRPQRLALIMKWICMWESPNAQMEKTCFVLAYLTSQGRVPLLGLNDVIAGVLQGWPQRRVGWLLLQTFYQCRLATNPNTGVSKRMEWLLELMGHIRNATDFLFQVFAAAVVSWGDHSMPLLFGIRAQWFPWQPGSKPQTLQHGLYGEESSTDHALLQCMLGMPHSLALLLNKEPWSNQTHKFIDWLFSITEGPEQSLSATTISTAKAALLALKSSAEFKKKAVWTRAYGW